LCISVWSFPLRGPTGPRKTNGPTGAPAADIPRAPREPAGLRPHLEGIALTRAFAGEHGRASTGAHIAEPPAGGDSAHPAVRPLSPRDRWTCGRLRAETAGGSGRGGRSPAPPTAPPSATLHGVKVQAGGDGEGRAGVRVSPGCGTPRGGGPGRRQRRRQGRGGRPHPGAAPHGARVQTGSNGRGRARAGVLTRVRHPTGPGFKRAATAEAGPGRAPSPGGGTPRGQGPNGRQRRRQGRGGRPGRVRPPPGPGGRRGRRREVGAERAAHPGAAPHGAGVQAGGDGGSGPRGRSSFRPALPERAAPKEGGQSRRAGVRGSCPPGRITGTEQAGRPAHLLGGPDDVYRRVAPPGGRTPPPRSPTVTGQGSLRGRIPAFRPPWRPFPVSGPLFSRLRAGSHPRSPPRPRAAGARRPDPGPGCAPRRHRGDVEVRRALPHTLTVRVRAGQRGFGGLRRAGLSPGATRARPPAPPHAITAPHTLPALAARL